MCYKGWEDNYVVLRVPFRKNGSGMHLNQYSVSLFVKFRELDQREDFGLLASQGWDQFSKPKENESVESALAFVTDTGGLGALGSFGDKRHVLNNTWHTITVTVDTVAGCMKTYCDAELVATIQSGKITRDGQFALRGRVALLHQDGPHSVFYLRSATVHSRVLSHGMVASEHAMHKQLHLLDAIQSAPAIHRATLSANHARQPYASVDSMVAALTKLNVQIDQKASALWDLIQARDPPRLRSFLEDLAQDDGLAETFWTYAASWSKVTTVADQKNETVSPFGETILHATAFAGHLDLVLRLLKQGADINCKGKHSYCSALHSAAAAGHVQICRELISAGIKLNIPSLSGKTALYVAASKGWYDVVKILVEGGSDPYSGGPTSVDTPMALLRKVSSEQGRKFVAEMDALWDARTGAKTSAANAANGAGVEAGDSDEDTDTNSSAGCSSDDTDLDAESDEVREEGGAGADEGVPICPTAGHFMVAKVGSYVTFSCNTCGDYLHGKRWWCEECQDDICFECRPEEAKPRDPAEEIAHLYKADGDDGSDEEQEEEYDEEEE